MDAGSSRLHSPARRNPADEHLREALPRVAGRISLEVHSHRAGGDDLFSEVVLLQHLRTLLVEPRDADPARDPEPLQADAGLAAREADPRAVPDRQRGRVPGLAEG